MSLHTPSSPKPGLTFTGGTNIPAVGFSPDERYVAFVSSHLTTQSEVHCYDLSSGAQRFSAKVHDRAKGLAWTSDGRLVTIASGKPPRVEARDPQTGKVTHSFTPPAADSDAWYDLDVDPAGQRIMFSTAQQNPDAAYAYGAPGFAWILDASTLAVRRHLDMRAHHPPVSSDDRVSTSYALHPRRDAIATFTYTSSNESGYFLEYFPEEGAAARTSVPKNTSLHWLDETRLLLLPPDSTQLEPSIVDTATLEDRRVINVPRAANHLIRIDADPPRVWYYDGGSEEALCALDTTTLATTKAIAWPRALRGGPPWACALLHDSATPRMLFVLSKGRMEEVDGKRTRRTGIRFIDSGARGDREVGTIGTLYPYTYRGPEPLRILVSPRDQWVAIVVLEGVGNKMRLAHLIVTPLAG